MGVRVYFIVERVRLLGGPSLGVMLSLQLERVLLLGGSSVGMLTVGADKVAWSCLRQRPGTVWMGACMGVGMKRGIWFDIEATHI
eukprot:1150959-Pelagomonas_calceolata.AAC.3